MIIPLQDVALELLPESVLSERDLEVLNVLSDEEFNIFTFEGLKRRLGLHPETLSRILTRLEAEGIITKGKEGYEVKNTKRPNHSRDYSDIAKYVLLQTFLPSYLPTKLIVSNLRGRWFGLLRWLGLTENDKTVILKWVTENGEIQLEAKIASNSLKIEAKFLHGRDHDLALKAAHQLMTHISALSVRSPKTLARSISFYANSDYYTMLT
jgi:hypothetical protein